ncbi:glycosyltransferase [filamentous cyanobacterium LEGE 11480]|uniref:Glycosyltransferase n=1 Tax=Romeriopsis navalis LEGE 11480 TaxID=2777977 RepID=A0A928VKM3_9CYAN|nr:glycosyltransferase [Romeriopsis navalis]MBE9030075.1 glycosyltransferase [Romeriopsis navalis LEGE 11480]
MLRKPPQTKRKPTNRPKRQPTKNPKQPNQAAKKHWFWGPSAQSSVPTQSQPALQCLTPIVVILPIHNEQASLPGTLKKVTQYIYRHPHVTFVFIDDGSVDRSCDILTQGIRNAKTPQLQMLTYKQRAGKGYAVRMGMRAAVMHCEYLCLLDGDLAYSLDHLDDLMIALQSADIAIGNRALGITTEPKRHWLRGKIRQFFTQLARKGLGLAYPDPQAGLKGFRQPAAQLLFDRQSLTGFSFDLELLYLAKKYGFSVAQIPAQVSQPHQLKVSQVKLVKDHLWMLKDLMRIYFNNWVGRYR